MEIYRLDKAEINFGNENESCDLKKSTFKKVTDIKQIYEILQKIIFVEVNKSTS